MPKTNLRASTHLEEMTLNVNIRDHDKAEEQTVILKNERVDQPYGVPTKMMTSPPTS
jgi:hypothetical protein